MQHTLPTFALIICSFEVNLMPATHHIPQVHISPFCSWSVTIAQGCIVYNLVLG